MRELMNGLGWVIAVGGGVTLAFVGVCGSFFIPKASLLAAEIACGGALLVGIALLCLVPRNPPRPPDTDKTS